MKVLFADSAKIRAFVSFRNVIVEIVLKGRSKKEGVSTTSSSSDGELTDDVLPDILDVLAKFRDAEKQTTNDKGESIVISEALLSSLQEIIVRADRSTHRGRNLWKVATRRLISATFSIENTRATTVRAFESVFLASALDFTRNEDEEKVFWQDVCEDAIDPIVSATRETYYGKHVHKYSAPKNEGFLEAKAFSLATFFPRLVSNVTSASSTKDIGYDIVSVGCAKAFAKADVASTSLTHALSCIAAFGSKSTSSSERFWSFACDFLENAIHAQKKNERTK